LGRFDRAGKACVGDGGCCLVWGKAREVDVSSGLLVIVGLLGPVVLGWSVWAEWATLVWVKLSLYRQKQRSS
jgi:hypothetical protein